MDSRVLRNKSLQILLHEGRLFKEDRRGSALAEDGNRPVMVEETGKTESFFEAQFFVALGKHHLVPASYRCPDPQLEPDIAIELPGSTIPAKHKAEFESMKFENMACRPLRVYHDNVFVEPGNVNEALTDAMVDVYFTIRHFYMREKKFDTFQADIQQIKIVKPGASIMTSGFKERGEQKVQTSAY
ncbi:hypothetical protein M405DRAFT_911902 [Rhizopogon salebrosus TDB-379]|nr:hypothetical protein M405DRAFT_911902 [Rhizopogon salebrosus TDB-379]